MTSLKERHDTETDPQTRSMLLFEMLLKPSERKQWIENERLFVQIKSPHGGYYVIDCMSYANQVIWLNKPLTVSQRVLAIAHMRNQMRRYGERYAGLWGWTHQAAQWGLYDGSRIEKVGYTCIYQGKDCTDRWGDFLVSLLLVIRSTRGRFGLSDPNTGMPYFPYPHQIHDLVDCLP